MALLSQLLDGEPPFVWDTLERMLDAGVELGAALGQLRMVLLSTMHDVIGGDEYSDDEYRRRLARLPLVIRLIASFEHQPAPEGAITMRPHRLRALLGL